GRARVAVPDVRGRAGVRAAALRRRAHRRRRALPRVGVLGLRDGGVRRRGRPGGRGGVRATGRV
ncbi:MAG: hypothetical protein AVDCRST_MAG57-3434, partial [uncultured Blastococcus sp.]